VLNADAIPATSLVMQSNLKGGIQVLCDYEVLMPMGVLRMLKGLHLSQQRTSPLLFAAMLAPVKDIGKPGWPRSPYPKNFHLNSTPNTHTQPTHQFMYD
jgi:hypothetical protein